MSIEIKVPVLPESVSDATIATWHKQPGEFVKRDENLVDLETDKVVLEVPAPADGVLASQAFAEGDVVTSGQVLGILDEQATGTEQEKPAAERQPAKAAEQAAPAPTADYSPAVRKLLEENDIDPATIQGTGRGGRIIKEDVLNAIKNRETGPAAESGPAPAGMPVETVAVSGARPEERVPMTRLRKRIAERLQESRQNTVMLTSFNEVDLSTVIAIRKKYREAFEKKHGVKLGFMSFFVKATAEALRKHPIINASVDGDDIIYHGYQDIGIAVATDKGLVVPILRNAGEMTLADIERQIASYAKQAREGGLKLEDLQGGTFTITNGGVFGSLFSTPIINPPQSAILGMHAIKERAVVVDGEVVARPMMYIALTYDHRIIDGKDAVLFLVEIKNALEDPHRLLLNL